MERRAIERRLLATARACCAVVVGGCAEWCLPRIDPTGEHIFAPAPETPLNRYWETPGGQLPSDMVDVLLWPKSMAAPVGSEVVLIAGVAGSDNYLRMNERVEWSVAPGSVGEIVEYDRAGVCDVLLADFNWPRKVTNTFAIGSTSRHDLRLTQGTPTPDDDVFVRRGQTWVTVSSPVEGTSYVTAYAPSVYGWDRHKQTATIHWVDADWRLPTTAINPAGARHTLTTSVMRHTDQTPRPGWRVRYTVASGPSAGFAPNGAPSIEVETDAQGQASAELFQLQPAAGTNAINVQVLRPAAPGDPLGTRLAVGGGSTLATWSAPGLTLRAQGPAAGSIGATLSYRFEVTNVGDLPAESVVIVDEVPQGLSYLGSTPAGQVTGRGVRWEIGRLTAGECRYVQVDVRADQAGTVSHCAEVSAANGLHARECASTAVAIAAAAIPQVPPGQRPLLSLSVTGPSEAVVGEQARFQIAIANLSPTPVAGIEIHDRFDPGLIFPKPQENNEIRSVLRDPLAPGQTQTVEVVFEVAKAGPLCHTVEISADGGFRTSKQTCVTGIERGKPRPPGAGLAVQVSATERRVPVGETVLFNIDLTNNGSAPLATVTVRSVLDPDLKPDRVTDGYRFEGNELVWYFPSLQPGDPKRVQILCRSLRPARNACCRVTVGTPLGTQAQQSTCVEILPAASGAPAASSGLTMDIYTATEPVNVGGELTYRITVANQGSAAEQKVALSVVVPQEMVPSAFGTRGPTPDSQEPPFRISNQVIQFQTLPELKPGEKMEYRIRVQAVKATPLNNPAAVVARLSSASLRTSLEKQAKTTVNPSR